MSLEILSTSVHAQLSCAHVGADGDGRIENSFYEEVFPRIHTHVKRPPPFYCQVWQQVWGVKEFRSRPRVSARAALAHERRAVTTLLIFCRGRAPQLGTEWIPRAPRRSHSLFLGAHRRPRHRPGCCSCSVGGRRRGTLDPRWLALMCGYINPFIP